jgi:quinol monooxygenase YgiN
MHAVIRQYTADPDVAEQARPLLEDLKQTMRQTPGFVAYYFLETDDGIATITITDDETGTAESMTRAAQWVRDNLPNSGLGAPRVTSGTVAMSTMR